jgi:hypothetical protein
MSGNVHLRSEIHEMLRIGSREIQFTTDMPIEDIKTLGGEEIGRVFVFSKLTTEIDGRVTLTFTPGNGLLPVLKHGPPSQRTPRQKLWAWLKGLWEDAASAIFAVFRTRCHHCGAQMFPVKCRNTSFPYFTYSVCRCCRRTVEGKGPYR